MIPYHKLFDTRSAIQFAADLKGAGLTPIQIIKKISLDYSIDLHDAKNIYDASLPEVELRAVIKFREELETVIAHLERTDPGLL